MTQAVGTPRVEQPARARVDWWGRPALKLHAALVAGLAGSAAAAWFEWTRALSGHEIAWVYSFEWPLFAVLGTHVWWRLLHDDGRPRRGIAPQQPAPDAGAAPPADPALAAWEDYLRRLHAADPPGGPPPRADDVGRSAEPR